MKAIPHPDTLMSKAMFLKVWSVIHLRENIIEALSKWILLVPPWTYWMRIIEVVGTEESRFKQVL